MAGVISNEPYQRVSLDNNVFDGALIGSAIGAGGAGAGLFGSRMNYKGIEKRQKRHFSNLQKQKDYYISEVNEKNRDYSRRLENTYSASKRERLSNKQQKKMTKLSDRIQGVHHKMSNQPSLQSLQEKHLYSKAGGWKNAAIIGASAVVGAGIGMIADGVNN